MRTHYGRLGVSEVPSRTRSLSLPPATAAGFSGRSPLARSKAPRPLGSGRRKPRVIAERATSAAADHDATRRRRLQAMQWTPPAVRRHRATGRRPLWGQGKEETEWSIRLLPSISQSDAKTPVTGLKASTGDRCKVSGISTADSERLNLGKPRSSRTSYAERSCRPSSRRRTSSRRRRCFIRAWPWSSRTRSGPLQLRWRMTTSNFESRHVPRCAGHRPCRDSAGRRAARHANSRRRP